MKYTLGLCLILGTFTVLVSCTMPQSPPALPTRHYTAPTHEVTNGVCVVFDTMPAPSLVTQLTSAGAIINTNGTIFVFDAVNTDERRLAVRAALLNGATMKGAPR